MNLLDEAAVYERDGKIIYRASAIGGCLTALAAARQGMERREPTGRVAEVYAAGHEAEEKFFARHPELALNRQLPVWKDVTSKITVLGHLDSATDEALIEVKSQSDEEYKKWSIDSFKSNPLWIKYSWQISLYQLTHSKPIHLWRVNRDTDAEDLTVINQPFWTLEDITDRVLEVEMLAREEKLQCSKPDFFCDYPYLHETAEVVDDPELEELVEQYLTWKNKGVEAEGHLRMLKDRIDKRMQSEGRDKVVLLSGRTVSRSEYEVKEHVRKASKQVRITVNGLL